MQLSNLSFDPSENSQPPGAEVFVVLAGRSLETSHLTVVGTATTRG